MTSIPGFRLNRLARLLMLALLLIATTLTATTLIATTLIAQEETPPAQDRTFSAEEQGWIDTVQTAFDNMNALDTVRTAVTQTISQTISAQDNASTTLVDQTIDAALDHSGDSPAMTVTVVQQASIQADSQTVEVPLTLDLVVLGDAVYLRIRDVADELVGVFPKGWVTPDEFPDMQMLNYEQYIQNINPGAQYPITPETVKSISQLEPDTLDELAMRVFTIDLDTAALVESEAYGQLDQLFSSSSSQDTAAILKEMFREAQMTMTLWIGQADQLVYRVKFNMQVDAELSGLIPGADLATRIQMTVGSQVDYHSFNEPVEIEAPQLGE